MLDNKYAPIIYSSFIKSVIKNFRGVTFCAEVRGRNGRYLRVIQDGVEVKFEYDNIDPRGKFEDLKELEDRMFKALKD